MGIPNMNTVANIRQADILERCVSIDLEVEPEKVRIFAFAAVTQDPETPILVVNSTVKSDFPRLDSFCHGFDRCHRAQHTMP